MATELPAAVRRLFEEPNLGFVSTLMPDGGPHVTPVWVDLIDGLPAFNTGRERIKRRNLERDPRVAIAVAHRDDPYEAASIRGRIATVTLTGGREHLDRLAGRYLGLDRHPSDPDSEVRVIVRIDPEQIHYFNPTGRAASDPSR